jgi:hypothetical protein
MPFSRFGLSKFMVGTMLAVALGSLSHASAQTAGPTADAPFSGTYIGTTQLVIDNDPGCPPGGSVTLEVKNGRFRLPWNEPQAFHVKISPDGSFYATSANAVVQSDKRMMIVPVLQGRLSGARLVAEYGTRWCHYRLDTMRS